MTDALFESQLDGLELVNRGKVRDIYALDDAHMLIVTTDRLSAFDVVLPQPIPGQGRGADAASPTSGSAHRPPSAEPPGRHPAGAGRAEPQARATLGERAIVVRRLRPLPVEAIVPAAT
jgi:phosphoribosylaminoimidazole-succinocarboxamide synthase